MVLDGDVVSPFFVVLEHWTMVSPELPNKWYRSEERMWEDIVGCVSG
jgi:hypothetical protein